MKDLTPAAMDVLARHHGVATHRMLTMAGVGRRVRQRLVAAGVLLPIHADVVRIASAPAASRTAMAGRRASGETRLGVKCHSRSS